MYTPWIIMLVALSGLYFFRIGSARVNGMEVSGVRARQFNSEIFMRVVTSLAVLLSALYVILIGGYDEGAQKWAFGAIGMVLGHWLKRE